MKFSLCCLGSAFNPGNSKSRSKPSNPYFFRNGTALLTNLVEIHVKLFKTIHARVKRNGFKYYQIKKEVYVLGFIPLFKYTES